MGCSFSGDLPMNSTFSTTEPSLEVPSDSIADGRSLRRERNVEAARNAAIELLSEGVHPSLADIAERAGVATRSVYRYFGDADSAIADAVRHRLDRARAVFGSEPAIGPSMPFEERLAMLILRRLRLERLLEPISAQPLAIAAASGSAPFDALDDEVRDAFGPELDRHRDDPVLDGLLCAMFRLQSVRSMRSTFDDSDSATAIALSRTVQALLRDATDRAAA